MRLTFFQIKQASEWIETGDLSKFCDFLNSFEGSNVYHKFKNIIKKWDYHVNDFLNFNIEGNQVKVPLYYFLNELSDELDGIKSYSDDNLYFEFQIPEKFRISEDNILLYDIIKKVSISEMELDFTNLNYDDRKLIIDKLPAKMFSKIIDKIIKDNSKIFKLSSESLSKFSINFYTNAPYIFLKGLFSNYSKEYFQDVMFYLSKRIGGEIIMSSDMKDVEFYIRKYNEELESQKNNLPSLDL